MMLRHASRNGHFTGRATLVGDAGAPEPMPVCPFARRGMDDARMATCPGFEAATVSFNGLGAGESLGRRVSCGHMDVQRGARGFVTACMHPGGLPAGAAEAAARRGGPQRG